MLILVLIDVQYSQKAVLSFEKGSNRQNQFSSGSLHSENPGVKKYGKVDIKLFLYCPILLDFPILFQVFCLSL